MPPPTISRSTFSSSASRIVSLVLTFEPATIATSGRFGFSSARSSASSSPTSSGPAQATGAKRATPCVEASARCAVPKASMTNTSHSAAMLLRKLFVVLLLALVEAHVLAQHDLAGLDVDALRASPSPAARCGRAAPTAARQPAPATAPDRTCLPPDDPGATSGSRARPSRAPVGWWAAPRGCARRWSPRHPSPARSDPRGSARACRAGRASLISRTFIAHDLSLAFDQASAVSSMRFEKPHSLSYHEHTFTRLPSMILVSVAS